MDENNSGSIFDIELRTNVNTDDLDDLDKRLEQYKKLGVDLKVDVDFSEKIKPKDFESMVNLIERLHNLGSESIEKKVHISLDKSSESIYNMVSLLERFNPKLKIDDGIINKQYEKLIEKAERLRGELASAGDSLLREKNFDIFAKGMNNIWQKTNELADVFTKIDSLYRASDALQIAAADEKIPYPEEGAARKLIAEIDTLLKNRFMTLNPNKNNPRYGYETIRDTNYNHELKSSDSKDGGRSQNGNTASSISSSIDKEAIDKFSDILSQINEKMPNNTDTDDDSLSKNSELLGQISENVSRITETLTLDPESKTEELSAENELLGKISESVSQIYEKINVDTDDDSRNSKTVETMEQISENLSQINNKIIPESEKESEEESVPVYQEDIKSIENTLDSISTETGNIVNATQESSGTLKDIHSMLSKGLTVKGLLKTDPSETPSTNFTSADITSRTEMLKSQAQSYVSALEVMLNNSGGLGDNILSKSDASDLLNRLKDIDKQLDSIVGRTNRNGASNSKLQNLNKEIDEINSKLSDPNVLNQGAFVERYAQSFQALDTEIEESTKKLEEFKQFYEQLSSHGIDASSFESAYINASNELENVINVRANLESQIVDSSSTLSNMESTISATLQPLEDSLSDIANLSSDSSQRLSSLFELDSEIKDAEKLYNQIEKLENLIKRAKKNNFDLSLIDLENGNTLADAEKFLENFKDIKAALTSAYSENQFADETEFNNFKANVETNLIKPMREYVEGLSTARIEVGRLEAANDQMAKSDRLDSQAINFQRKISNKISELAKWSDNNNRALQYPEYKAKWEDFFNRLKSGLVTSEKELQRFNEEWADFNRKVTESGKNGKTFTSVLGEMFKKFGGWTLVTRTISKALRLMKDMVVQVKEVDSAMVNLRKVTDASEAALDKYLKHAGTASVDLGTSLTDEINATAQFSRLGYNLDEAQKLGELASKYKSVAEDLDIDTASQSIVSTLKAFNNLGTTAEEVVDKFNYVGKLFAL